MSKFIFYGFSDYEDGKIAHLETTGEYEIPVNIFIDNADEIGNIQDGTCNIDVCAVGNEVSIYSSEEEYYASGAEMAVISMIPSGTFPLNEGDDNFEQSPHIIYTGRVTDVEQNTEASPDEANYCITIETLELSFRLYLRYDSEIEIGNIVYGYAWLFGDMEL